MMLFRRKFHVIAILCGCLLIAFLVRRIGVDELWIQLRMLGWALVPLILIEGIADLFHTQAWRHCLSDEQRAIPFMRIFCIRMAGYSINYLTPTAGMGGEVAKGVLLAADGAGLQSATGIIVDKLSYALAQMIFVAGGTLAMLHGMRMSGAVWIAMLTATTLLAAGMLIFLLMQRYGKLGSVLRWLVNHRIGGQRVERAAVHLTEVDEQLRLFYQRRRTDLLLSILWHIAGMALGILQCYYFLMILTADASLGLAAGLWFLGTWFSLLSFALPIDLGVMEGTRVIAFVMFGLDSSLGLAYGVTLRFEQLFWAGVGLLMYAVLVARMRKYGAAGRQSAGGGLS